MQHIFNHVALPWASAEGGRGLPSGFSYMVLIK